MKKYLRLTCSICKRSADQLVDQTHFTTDKCTITFKCQGRLFPVEYRSNAEITSVPAIGVTDWRARGTVVTSSVATKETTFVDTSTGSKNQIVLAVKAPSAPPSGSLLKLKLNQRADTQKNFRQYIFRVEGSFSSVSGVESGLEKKTLRYSTTDLVEVFLNGVKLESGVLPENFQTYDGTPSSVVAPNTIVFNQTIALSGISQVDVIVSQAVTTSQVELTFKRNISDESRSLSGAWENVDTIEKYVSGVKTKFYLFTLDLADAPLSLNSVFTADTQATIVSFGLVQSTDIEMLLARKPYSILDRYTSISINLATLSFEKDYLKYFAVDGSPVLYVTDTSVAPVYPIMTVSKFIPEVTIKTAVSGVATQIVVDGSVIVGPDV